MRVGIISSKDVFSAGRMDAGFHLTLCGDSYLIHAPTVSLARKVGHPIILAMMEG